MLRAFILVGSLLLLVSCKDAGTFDASYATSDGLIKLQFNADGTVVESSSGMHQGTFSYEKTGNKIVIDRNGQKVELVIRGQELLGAGSPMSQQ